MWIIRLAPQRQYTFMVMAILIAIMGGLSIVTTATARSNRAHAFGVAGYFLGRS